MRRTLTVVLTTLLIAGACLSLVVASHHEDGAAIVGYALEPATSDAPVTPKVLRNDEHVKIALVTIAAGATMPEHAAPVPVTVQTLSGSGSMTVSGEPHELSAGTIYYMEANAPHALDAQQGEPLVVLVHYLKGGTGKAGGH